MMPLTPEEVRTLLLLVTKTEEQEIDCDEFLDLMAVHVERIVYSLRDQGHDDNRFLHHMKMCPECLEEFSTVLKLLGPNSTNDE